MGHILEEPLVDSSTALHPNDIAALPALLEHVTKGVNVMVNGEDVDRKSILVKCRALAQAIETPRETMIRHCWAETGAIAALNFGVDSGLWLLMARNGDAPQKATDLAASLGVDPKLLCRLMRHLAAMGYLAQTGKDEYKATNYSKAMSLPVIGNGYLAMLSCTSAGAMRFHEFSRLRGWQNPADAKDTSMMYAYDTDKNMFAWQQHMGYGTHFNDHMSGRRLGRLPWMHPSLYPVQERLIDGASTDPDAPFLVEIGGSMGDDLAEFLHYYPKAPGRLVLQDLPVVIDQIKRLDPVIIRMGYDCLTEQPVKGARAYYVHSLLNNWPDDKCVKILKRIKEAMKPGYSRLLLNEHVMPQDGAYWETSALDMVMLTLFSSEERTMPAWQHLLEVRAGLRIVQVWEGGKGVQNVIECQLDLASAV